MADKRMFSNKVTGNDDFLEMPASTQNLYFHLSMNADDDGFIDKYKSIMRMIGAKEDDLKVLIGKSFLIPFDSGVLVIKHWRINNYLRSDRYKPTQYLDEKAKLCLEKNGEYGFGIPNGNLDKNRLDKNSIDYNIYNNIMLIDNEQVIESNIEIDKDFIDKEKFFDTTWIIYPRKVSKVNSKQTYFKKIKGLDLEQTKFTANQIYLGLKNQIELWSKENNGKGRNIEHIPHFCTWLNANFEDNKGKGKK